MGRPERPLDPSSGPAVRFACELRKLRREGGGIGYRQMAGQVGYSTTALSVAASGRVFPSWSVTRAFVIACGGDEATWLRSWTATAEEIRKNRQPTESGMVDGAVNDADAAPVYHDTRQEYLPPNMVCGPLVPGDDSQFVVDATVPDGTVVFVGQTFQKVWEIRNTGTAVWENRYLRRLGSIDSPGLCRSERQVPISRTLPGGNWSGV